MNQQQSKKRVLISFSLALLTALVCIFIQQGKTNSTTKVDQTNSASAVKSGFVEVMN